MQKKRLRLIIWSITVVVITLLAIAGSHIYNNVGSLYSDEMSVEKFGKYSYYSQTDHQFISPQVIEYYKERTTGGDADFMRFFKNGKP